MITFISITLNNFALNLVFLNAFFLQFFRGDPIPWWYYRLFCTLIRIICLDRAVSIFLVIKALPLLADEKPANIRSFVGLDDGQQVNHRGGEVPAIRLLFRK